MNESEQNNPTQGAGQGVQDTFGEATAQDNGQEQQGAGGGEGADAGAGSSAQRAAPLDLSEATVQRLAGSLAGAMPKQQAQPQQPQMTPEQIDDMLKVVKINDPDLAEALGLDDERTPKAAKFMRDLVNKIVTHINVVSDVRQRMFMQQHINPINEYVQQSRNDALERQFFDTFPDLKPHSKIARLVYKDMISQGARFNTPDEAFHAIAKATKALVGGGGTNNSDTAGNGAGANEQASQMSTIAMGGRASGATTGQQKSSNPIKELFG